MLHKTLKSYYNDNPWDDEEEHPDGLLWLLTPEELDDMPNGLVLEDIVGGRAVIGKSDIDTDTRFGYIAYGIRGHREH